MTCVPVVSVSLQDMPRFDRSSLSGIGEATSTPIKNKGLNRPRRARSRQSGLERVKGLEPSTFSLGS